jgi:hypothetical protein
VIIVSADSQIRPDERRTDGLYIECVDDIYTAALFTLHKPLLQPPKCQLMLVQEHRTYFGIFFSPVDPPPCPTEGFLTSASLISGAGRGTTFSINSSFNGAGYPVAMTFSFFFLSLPHSN